MVRDFTIKSIIKVRTDPTVGFFTRENSIKINLKVSEKLNGQMVITIRVRFIMMISMEMER